MSGTPFDASGSIRASATAILALAILAGNAFGQIELRENAAVPEGKVVRVDADGVTLVPGPGKSPPAAPVVLGWDRVRSVSGPLAQQAAIFAPIATQAWRARSRLARGDAVGAEPLFESLFAAYSRRSGATTATISEGLAICRLGRGAQTSAVAPWLAWIRAGGTQSLLGADDLGNPDSAGPRFAPDPATGLIPSLPPIWIDLPAVRSFARGSIVLEPLDEGVSPSAAGAKAERLAQLYLTAAQLACGLDAPALPETSDDPAVKLVGEIVAAMSVSPELRDTARSALRSRIKSKPPAWVEAWARVAIGRSLLLDDAPDSKRLGVIELLHLPARIPDDVPYLTGIALAESAVALHLLGDDAGADRLRSELATDYSGHPALDWAPLRGWKSPNPAPNPAPSSPGAITADAPRK